MAARAFRTGERRRRWAEGGVRWSEHFRVSKTTALGSLHRCSVTGGAMAGGGSGELLRSPREARAWLLRGAGAFGSA